MSQRKDKKKVQIHPLRIFGIWLISLAAFLLMAEIMTEVQVESLRAAVIFITILALINAFIRPLIVAITLPLSILTLGFFSLLINAFFIGIVADFMPGIETGSLWSTIWLSVGLSLITALFHAIFAIDDVEMYETYVLRRRSKGKEKQIKTDKPGVVFLEIDGLSHPVIQRAIQNAYMPNLAKLLRETHHIVGWECDFSSATPGSQAGLLLGNNKDMPAFRWYDRSKQKVVTMGNFRDASEVQTKQAKGIKGLLSKDGVSINNMFNGGAPTNIMTSSVLVEKGSIRRQSALYYFFANPINFIRTFFLYFVDIYYELKDHVYQSRHDVQPRLPFHYTYPFIRAATTVFMRELGIAATIGKMMEGAPSMYVTLVAYDEIAHHSGVERSQAMYMLQQIDKQFAKVIKATEYTPRPYHLVFLSDHGQSQGATFLQRYGFTLEDHIKQLLKGEYQVAGSGDTDESWDRINIMLTDAIGGKDTFTRKVVKPAMKSKTDHGSVVIGPSDSEQKQLQSLQKSQQDIVILASGNLGMVYFTKHKKRMNLEQLEKLSPDLIPGLVNHPGIGFIMVASKKGTLVIGQDGIYNLNTDKITGTDPLQLFDPSTKDHLKRQAKFKHLPDIMINSFYDPGTDEIAAFEELIGAHGGIGGNQNKPFLMYPKALEPSRLDGITGTDAVHKIIKKWAFAAA